MRLHGCAHLPSKIFKRFQLPKTRGLIFLILDEQTEEQKCSAQKFHCFLISLVSRISAKNPPILLVFSAAPVNLITAKYVYNCGAIIQCFYPAQATGDALREVLFTRPPGGGTKGRGAAGMATSPAGRLPYTWPSYMEQVLSGDCCVALVGFSGKKIAEL